MGFNIEDLAPANPRLIIQDELFEFRVMNLKDTARLVEEFGSVKDAIETIHTHPKHLFYITHILLVDKSKYTTWKKFYYFCLNGDIAKISQGLAEVLNLSVKKSQPIKINTKAQQEFNRLNGNDSIACYGKYYDAIASRYKYTLDEFLSLTLRQLVISLNAANDGQYEDFEAQAALAGKKLKPQMKALDMDEKKEKMYDDLASENLKRMQEEYKAKQAAKK